MVSEPSSPMTSGDVGMAEKTPHSNKRSHGKVPKKIHKAEREKLKRDHLNELFCELGYALVEVDCISSNGSDWTYARTLRFEYMDFGTISLDQSTRLIRGRPKEPARQNNGKASILSDATRLLRDLIAQVDSLRKENVALITESHYVSVEKNELKDEKTVLETEISRLHTEVQERMHSDTPWRSSTDAVPATFPHQTNTVLPIPQPLVAYVLPPHQDLQPCPEAETMPEPPKPPSHVSRPRPRYARPSDSWPLELLSRHPTTAQDEQHSSSSTSSLSVSVEEGSVKTVVDPSNCQ